jgi:peptidase E
MRKIVACGRGRVTQLPPIRKEVIALTGKKHPSVLYLGTATYDEESAFTLQTQGFADEGCKVSQLKITELTEIPSKNEIESTILGSDIILVSGGNTLFAMTRFRKLKIDKYMREAMLRGAHQPTYHFVLTRMLLLAT